MIIDRLLLNQSGLRKILEGDNEDSQKVNFSWQPEQASWVGAGA